MYLHQDLTLLIDFSIMCIRNPLLNSSTNSLISWTMTSKALLPKKWLINSIKSWMLSSISLAPTPQRRITSMEAVLFKTCLKLKNFMASCARDRIYKKLLIMPSLAKKMVTNQVKMLLCLSWTHLYSYIMKNIKVERTESKIMRMKIALLYRTVKRRMMMLKALLLML